ncbi:glycosyltransferase family A protein [Agromyces sp. LHK192]|uniref:glycosyltransferase family 2 protein n=1 Tax=Agromyces sp. LHK192 TaxID=2498704 RepID=UPI000FD85E0A|nr:glycosyltransferase family A protein [Agromyces sp. LHK192]
MTYVSVILPTYNRARLIERAIGSVLSQTHRELELIVVDDGSTDDTAALVEQVGDERVSFIRQENAGAPSARNRGVAAARGAWVAFQDSDDEWDPGFLESVVARAAPERVVFTSHAVIFRSGIIEVVPSGRVSNPGRTLLRGNIASMQTALLPVDLARSNPFDTSLPRFQDWDLWLALIEADVEFVHLPLIGATLHRQTDSISEGSLEVRQRSLRQILTKHRRTVSKDPVALARLLARAYAPDRLVSARHRQRRPEVGST